MQQLLRNLFGRFSDPDSAWFDVALIVTLALTVIAVAVGWDVQQQDVVYRSQLLPDAPAPSALMALVDTVTSGVAALVFGVAGALIGLRLYSERRVTGIVIMAVMCGIGFFGTTLARYVTTPTAPIGTLAALITFGVMLVGIPLVMLEREGAWGRVFDADSRTGRRGVLQLWACNTLIARLGWGAAANLLVAMMSVTQNEPSWLSPWWSFALWSVIVLTTAAVVDGMGRLAEASTY